MVVMQRVSVAPILLRSRGVCGFFFWAAFHPARNVASGFRTYSGSYRSTKSCLVRRLPLDASTFCKWSRFFRQKEWLSTMLKTVPFHVAVTVFALLLCVNRASAEQQTPDSPKMPVTFLDKAIEM